MAWAGIALAQLARTTGATVYRVGSVAVGRWIQANTFSDTGLGGYTFGETAGLERHKSTVAEATQGNFDQKFGDYLLAWLMTRTD